MSQLFIYVSGAHDNIEGETLGVWGAVLNWISSSREHNKRLAITGACGLSSLAAELRATLEALERVGSCQEIIVFCSDYVLRGATQWLALWEERGWKTTEGQPVKHREMWEALQGQCARNNIEFRPRPVDFTSKWLAQQVRTYLRYQRAQETPA